MVSGKNDNVEPYRESGNESKMLLKFLTAPVTGSMMVKPKLAPMYIMLSGPKCMVAILEPAIDS